MGIFYNPPQPPTANNAGTPPEPHVPIGNQGTSVPPRRAVAFAATMAILVAAWPADLEPRLQRPNDQQNKIAPLTLPRGAQPPPIAPIAPSEWPQFVASWTQSWDAQRAIKSTAWNAIISPYRARTPPPAHIWTAWEPPPPLPVRPVTIAPLTLPRGAQPTPQSPLSTLEIDQIHRTWLQDWPAQTAPKNAAWNVPPIVAAFVPSVRFRYDILALNQDPLQLEIVQTFVVDQSSTDDPPRTSALSLANQAITQQAWTPAPTAPPTAAKNAAWNVPPPIVSTLIPRTPLPALIWTAWVEPFVRPPAPVTIAPLTPQLVIVANVPAVLPPYVVLRAWQEEPSRLLRPVTIAPLTLVYGNQPPVQPPLSAATRIVLQAWPADLEPRLGRPNNERVRIAPLTLVYGQQPPRQAPLSAGTRVVIAAWPLDLEPRLGRPNNQRILDAWIFPEPPPATIGVQLDIADRAVTDIAVTDAAVTELVVSDILLTHG